MRLAHLFKEATPMSAMAKSEFTQCLEDRLTEKGYNIIKKLSGNQETQSVTFLTDYQNNDQKDSRVVKISSVVLPGMGLFDFNPDKTDELASRETDLLRQINHPNIPKLLEEVSFSFRGIPVKAIALEYVEAQNLLTRIENKVPLSEQEAKIVLSDILDAIYYLQTLPQPVYHRDIKPSNILFTGSKAYLIDFNFSRTGKQGSGLTVPIDNFGYYPPDTYSGTQSISQDIVALGNTVIAAAYGKEIVDIRQEQLRIDLSQPIELENLPYSNNLRQFLRKLTNPRTGLRYHAAQVAKNDLSKLESLSEAQTAELLVESKRDPRLTSLLAEIQQIDPLFDVTIPAAVLDIISDDELIQHLRKVYSQEKIRYENPQVIQRNIKQGDYVESKGIGTNVVLADKGYLGIVKKIDNKEQVIIGFNPSLFKSPQEVAGGRGSEYDVKVSPVDIKIIGKLGWFSNTILDKPFKADDSEAIIEKQQIIEYLGRKLFDQNQEYAVPKGTVGIVTGSFSKGNIFVTWEHAPGLKAPSKYEQCHGYGGWSPVKYVTAANLVLVRKNPINFMEQYKKNFSNNA